VGTLLTKCVGAQSDAKGFKRLPVDKTGIGPPVLRVRKSRSTGPGLTEWIAATG